MADDSADFDAHSPTDVLHGRQIAESMTSTANLPTDLITDMVTSKLFAEPDAETVSLTRQCPRCGLMFSSDYDRCPVDNERLEAISGGLGGSLYGGDSDADWDTEMLGLDEPTNTNTMREAELAILGAADDGTIRGSVLDGRFLVEELIGEGGMGRVYRGSQLSVGRPVAIKVLHGRISNDQSIRERFNREARIVSAFNHPNTVRLIDFGDAQGHLYMAMEFVDGVSLQQFVGRAPMNVAFSLEVIRQICGPLAEAHKSDVVHRDLKPENLYITRTADSRLQVKLLDFGVAYIDPSSASEQADTYRELTRQGVVVGTPEYMAPEQARGETVTQATDVYALGVILYQMLSGILPFYGQTPMHTMFQLVTKPVPPITDHLPKCPLPLVELIEALLQKDPRRRLNNVVQVARRIREVHLQLGLRPLTELPDGDLRDVLEALVHTDTALGPTDEYVAPHIRSTERTDTPVAVAEVWQRRSDRPQRVTEQQTAPQTHTISSGRPPFEAPPISEAHVDPEPSLRVSGPTAAAVEEDDDELHMAVTEPTPAVQGPEENDGFSLGDLQSAPEEPYQLRTKPIVEPTAEIGHDRRAPDGPEEMPFGALKARPHVEPTELRKPYVPPDVPTVAPSSGSRFKLVALVMIIVGVSLAATAVLLTFVQGREPRPAPGSDPAPVGTLEPEDSPSPPPRGSAFADEPPTGEAPVEPERPTPEPESNPKPEATPKPKPKPKPESKPKPEPRPKPQPKPEAAPEPPRPVPTVAPDDVEVEGDEASPATVEPDPPRLDEPPAEEEEEEKEEAAPKEEPADSQTNGAPPLQIEGLDDQD